MPRVHYVKSARKANPVAQVGQPYYWWKFRRSGKHFSATPPKRSQLTQSAYYANQYDAEDAAEEALADIAECIRSGELDDTSAIQNEVGDAFSAITEAGNENAEQLEENADSMESGFGHETYQSEQMKERAQAYREWADDAENAADQLSLDEPPEQDANTDDEEHEKALDDWREETASMVEDLINDVQYQGE